MNALDELLPGLAEGKRAVGAVEGDDRSAGGGQLLSSGKIGGNAQNAIHIALLDADDGHVCILANETNLLGAVEAQGLSAGAHYGAHNAPQGVQIVQRIAGKCLA